MRLSIIQYAGDYREAFERFAKGGAETYHAQRYSVDCVGSLAQRLEQVCVICAITEAKYDTMLDNRVRAIGLGLQQGFNPYDVVGALAKTRPTRLSLTTPMMSVLKWANTNHVRTIAPLADSFLNKGFRSSFRHKLLAYQLNRSNIEWVGNHGINACLSLVDIGVSSDKIVPWDWPHSRRPDGSGARLLRGGVFHSLLYVGSVTPAKGVADLLQAFSILRQRGLEVTLSVIGKDPDGSMIALGEKLGISDAVHFLGVLPNERVISQMREADAIIIPSRHEYPEGLPLTIYEALSARTPIVASDHPMFRGILVDAETALIFSAGNVEQLVFSLRKVLTDAALYATLSQRSKATWEQIQLPVKMGSLLEAWISDDAAQNQWIKDHRLTSGKYDKIIGTRLGNRMSSSVKERGLIG